ncbi:MAG: hypothetical protein KKE86_02715 [Planctomycetes bacterium]|nr:hypothetical protein [Planctomycetota bacterium]MBU4398229.1 hypothetical protein [Planctomycetota bacterium]
MKYVFMMMLGLCLFAVGCDDRDYYPPGDQDTGANDNQDDGANDNQDDGANDNQDDGANDNQDDGTAGKSSGAPHVYSTPLVD